MSTLASFTRSRSNRLHAHKTRATAAGVKANSPLSLKQFQDLKYNQSQVTPAKRTNTYTPAKQP
ncbi:unnamed protein product [Arabidopsis halleri]